MEREPNPASALRRAADHTRRQLIDGFRPQKWAVLAFAAWLATLGASMRVRVPGLGRAPTWTPEAHQELQDVGPWMFVALVAIVLIAIFAVALRLVTLFVECRGAFVLVDGIVRDRAALAQPWRRYGRLADDLFVLRLEICAVELALLLVPAAVGLGALGVWAWLSPGEGVSLLPLAVGIAAVCALFIVAVVVLRTALVTVIDDLVVPVMYVRRCTFLDAWAFVVDAGRRWPRAAARYAALRLGVGVGTFALGTAVCVLFCCVQWIPLVDAALLLPLTVFKRSFSLQIVSQLADDLAVLGRAADIG